MERTAKQRRRGRRHQHLQKSSRRILERSSHQIQQQTNDERFLEAIRPVNLLSWIITMVFHETLVVNPHFISIGQLSIAIPKHQKLRRYYLANFNLFQLDVAYETDNYKCIYRKNIWIYVIDIPFSYIFVFFFSVLCRCSFCSVS